MRVSITAEVPNPTPGAPNQRFVLPKTYDSMQQAEIGIGQIHVDGGFYIEETPNRILFYPVTSVEKFVIEVR